MTRQIRVLGAVLLGLLAAQFLVGMITNLFAPIPPAVPGLRGNLDYRLGGAARWALLHGPPVLKIHVLVGLSIGACAIALVIVAFRAQRRPALAFALLGLLASGLAGLAGAAFLAYRRDNLYSLLMSVAFLAAIFTYGALLLLNRDRTC